MNAEAAALSTLDSGIGEHPPRASDRATSGMQQQIGRYRTLRVLGQGSAGIVHTAYDQLLDRVVALKTIHTDRSTSTDVGRFIREAKALARLSHPNIVHIYDVSTSGGQVFLAMEFIRGRTLRQSLGMHPRRWRSSGRQAQARRDFEAALVVFGATPDAPGERLRTATHLALAFMLVESDPGAALEHMVRAVACDEAPELAQDRLRHEPRIAARAAVDPAWARVLTEAPVPASCSGPSVR